MAYESVHVANSILERAFREGRSDISPMKLQKLLFFTHGWHLAMTGEPALVQSFDVWKYGPVIPTVYGKLKKFGSGPITEYLKDDQSGVAYIVDRSQNSLYRSLDVAWEKYVGIPAINLSAMTHEPDSPWEQARIHGFNSIPNEYIRGYFVRTANSTAH